MSETKTNPKIDFSVRTETLEEFIEWGKFMEWAASLTPEERLKLRTTPAVRGGER